MTTESDISSKLKEEGFREIDASVLRTRDYKEVIEHYDQKTGKWRIFVK